MVPVVFREAAAAEFEHERRWYESKRSGLGNDFTGAVDEAIMRISRDPELFPKVHGNTQRALVRRFPFAVFFVVEPEIIVVLAVFNCARDPSAWRSR